ncbi:hypothetical protein [Naasia aerilata]|uniref:Uncharacterized protein n=1 Tax=Naasia aerilata TaxID=1162966 RepID=A0ABN6XLL8_9MICO|nr:hypothetical protein [Naasia aerilata]BDZ45859.1 hypothetical protein GCM10025866_17680 [Naasia aerilata]
MRIATRLAAAVLAAGALTSAVATSALAAPQKETGVQLVGVVQQTGPSTATVQARYTCSWPVTAETPVHLWASVKQSADRTADPALAEPESGFGHVAATWSQTHVGDIVCDGRTHVVKVTVDQTEQGYGTLGKGDAWVQFCLTFGEENIVWSMEFLHVR